MELSVIPRTRISEPFWKAVAEGRLTLQFCEACRSQVFYPRARCPRCLGPLRWREQSGEGVLAAWTMVRRGPAAFADWAPYPLGIVEVDGARLFSVIASNDTLRLGARVRFRTDVGSFPLLRGMPTPFVFADDDRPRPGASPGQGSERGTT